MFGRSRVGRQVWHSWWWLGLVIAALLTACGEDATPTPNLAGVATPIDSNRPTVTPPFQAATNITPEPSVSITAAAPVTLQGTNSPGVTPTGVPYTPIIRPTPTSPTTGVLTSDDLGIGVWSDTEVLWSPKGDIFLLHVMRENSDGDFFYLVRPPDSVQSSFKLPRSVYSTMAWSPDGRYLSYIDRASDNATSGPVKLIDTQKDVTNSRKFFTGPCTGANWQAPGKLLATCGLALYLLSDDSDAAAKGDNQDPLFKLENNRFPGSNVDLSLLFNALPSPDGTTIAVFGLRRQNGPLPLGEIAFYNVASKKLDLLDRNNRPVTIVDWTPDSKYLILRNITGDQAITYTFDYYLADPVKLKITQNLTKSNDKCDPVLGPKPECQGTVPATVQSSRIVFAPDGDRYFFTGQRYVSRPNNPLSFAERLTLSRVSGGKAEQLTETQPGERIVGLSWLSNGHYFYSVGMTTAPAKAFLDGKPLELGSSGTKNAQASPKSTPAPTKAGAGSLSGFAFDPLQATSPSPEATAGTPVTTPGPATTPAQTATTAPATTVAATAEPSTPTPTSAPRGTSLLGFETVTAQARTPTPIPPTRTPDPNATASPTPVPAYPRPAAYYMSPAGNWVLVVERVAAADKVVQYQVRLVPYVLK